ncbi:MAG: hypothetical protein ISN28_16245 [Ectothiorhodospiraceae bacterium AqS1]|nr:hypothetical protein [Ectothiorhodospiraceae bacterium AqS1]MBF2761785.1 hypothetical protein [Ectothiorhodospiraceae bacterium AqS1]
MSLYIRCGNSINLLDVDTIEAGKSVSITHSDTKSVYPYSRPCFAHSSNPFTLSIKTVRLAQ